MLYSMTGYGKGEAFAGGLVVNVEIKSVNHRYADISVKMPRSFLFLENEIRKQVARLLKRGKIDLYVNYEMTAEAQARPEYNAPLAKAYHDLFGSMKADLGLIDPVPLSLIAAQKDVVVIAETELDPAQLQELMTAAVGQALEQLLSMRQAEGEQTRLDIVGRLETAEGILAQVEERAPAVPVEWQQRLQERLNRLQQNQEWDPQRVAQEVAVFADRCDISEELARFRSHLSQFAGLFDADEPVGRQMDFLVQELNREVNTMGSKSNDAELTRLVVLLKAELEKVREQVQNIE